MSLVFNQLSLPPCSFTKVSYLVVSLRHVEFKEEDWTIDNTLGVKLVKVLRCSP